MKNYKYYNKFRIAVIFVLISSVNLYAEAVTQTEGDISFPKIINTTPEDKEQEVDIDGIIVTFNKDLDEDSISNETFIVSYNEVGVNGTLNYGEKVITFTPLNEFEFDTTYTVTITTDIRDLDGNNLEEEYKWTFTTKKEGNDEKGCFITYI